MRKKLSFAALLMTSIALIGGILSFKANEKVEKTEAITEVGAQVFGVEVRDHFLVIKDYTIDVTQEYMSLDGSGYNAPSHVNVYTSETGDAIPLSSFIDSGNWMINLWSSYGVMFPISDENWQIYNGQTIYAIEILEGCTYPNNKLQKVVVPETIKYTNDHYNDPLYKNEALSWTRSFLPSEIPINLSGGQIRSDSGNHIYQICLTSNSYTGASPLEYSNLSSLNAYNKVKVFLSPTDSGHYLSEVTTLRRGYQNYWTSGALHFDITESEYSTYNVRTIYKIVVETGCNLVLNHIVVHVDNAYTLKNYSYGDTSLGDGVFFLYPEFQPLSDPIQLNDAQVRANTTDNFYFIDVRSSIYEGTSSVGFDNFDVLNTYSHIKIYLSENDTGTLLSNVTSLRNGYQNLWGSGAILFALTAEEYEIYNGTTIYMIEVLEGCELFFNDSYGVVDRGYSFINGDYGNPSAKYEAFNFHEEQQPLKDRIELLNAEVRADVENNFYFIDLRSSEYIGTTAINTVNLSSLNIYTHVKVYLSKDDSGAFLGDITTLRHGSQNLWTSAALMLALTAEEYEIYNGTTIYMVEVLEGCEMIVEGAMGVVDRGYRFVNNNYGSAEAKYSALNLLEPAEGLHNAGVTSVTSIHNRMDKNSNNRWLMFFLDETVSNSSKLVNSWGDQLNILDNVRIYMSEDDEPILLRDIYNSISDGIHICLFGTKNMVAICISNEKINEQYKYCGPHMYKVEIEPGTKFPVLENNVPSYRVTTEKAVFINDDYDKFGDIPDTRDDYDNPRIYEEWSVNWNRVSCVVTFTVVGIEGLSFPEMLLECGEKVSLDKFKYKGYSLTVAAKDGSKVYNCIIGANHNLEFVLTYTKNKGCGGHIISTAIIVPVFAGAALILLISLKKKEGRKHD